MRQWSRLLVVLLAAVVAVFAAIAAVRSESTVTVETGALQVALDYGLDAVIWEPTPEMQRDAEELAKTTGQVVVGVSGAGEIVIPRGRLITDVKQPLLVIWYPSAERAAIRVAADRPLFRGASRLMSAPACHQTSTLPDSRRRESATSL